jgi:tetratricopeptide (TPR) repeat protein
MSNKKTFVIITIASLILLFGVSFLFLDHILEGINKTLNTVSKNRVAVNVDGAVSEVELKSLKNIPNETADQKAILQTIGATQSSLSQLERSVPELEKAQLEFKDGSYSAASRDYTACLNRLSTLDSNVSLNKTSTSSWGRNQLISFIYQLRATCSMKEKRYDLAEKDLYASEQFLSEQGTEAAVALYDEGRAIEQKDPALAIVFNTRCLIKLWIEAGFKDHWTWNDKKIMDRKFFESLVYSARGYEYLLLKEYSVSINDLTRSIALRPEYKANYLNRSKAYQLTGKNELAEKDIQTAAALR